MASGSHSDTGMNMQSKCTAETLASRLGRQGQNMVIEVEVTCIVEQPG